jgi:hypothetical protein
MPALICSGSAGQASTTAADFAIHRGLARRIPAPPVDGTCGFPDDFRHSVRVQSRPPLECTRSVGSLGSPGLQCSLTGPIAERAVESSFASFESSGDTAWGSGLDGRRRHIGAASIEVAP